MKRFHQIGRGCKTTVMAVLGFARANSIRFSGKNCHISNEGKSREKERKEFAGKENLNFYELNEDFLIKSNHLFSPNPKLTWAISEGTSLVVGWFL